MSYQSDLLALLQAEIALDNEAVTDARFRDIEDKLLTVATYEELEAVRASMEAALEADAEAITFDHDADVEIEGITTTVTFTFNVASMQLLIPVYEGEDYLGGGA